MLDDVEDLPVGRERVVSERPGELDDPRLDSEGSRQDGEAGRCRPRRGRDLDEDDRLAIVGNPTGTGSRRVSGAATRRRSSGRHRRTRAGRPGPSRRSWHRRTSGHQPPPGRIRDAGREVEDPLAGAREEDLEVAVAALAGDEPGIGRGVDRYGSRRSRGCVGRAGSRFHALAGRAGRLAAAADRNEGDRRIPRGRNGLVVGDMRLSSGGGADRSAHFPYTAFRRFVP